MGIEERISASQMSVLFFIYLTGSSIINIPQPLINFANNGAWLSLILSYLLSLSFLGCILYMHGKYPDLTFIEYSKKTVGTWVTILLAIPFISFQFHMATGIVIDIGLFMTTTLMRETPIYVFNSLIYLLVFVTVRLGIEIMARLFVLLSAMVMFYVLLILALASFNYHPSYLLPVIPLGFKPILLGGYFSYGFPYVEVFLFSMILPFVSTNQNKPLKRGLFAALSMNAISLITVTLCTLMTYGPIAGERKYSMFQLARTIEFYELFQRIESLIGISLIVASYMKGTIVIFTLNLTFTQLFNLQNNRLLILPLTMICCILSLTTQVKGEAFWGNLVSVIHPIWGTLGYLVPVLLVTLVHVAKRKSKSPLTSNE
ncbi:spore gernimation protein [Paenibacillus sp. Soil766]|uniref:GerAB/ArcD/ProY family transporter n=1 Tax=Paenibacillus sp. Soil766 TaxID=1736404 RepID=UPI00070E054F|nr:endospore germination permease [Paenibacillus sp. Soil766]KRF03761.1 spore gernimation protein [Paenibacillus sp. Soil766]